MYKYFYIVTQDVENYGAHSEDGTFYKGEHHWKFKGGSEYIITGLDRVQDAVAFVARAFCFNTQAFVSFPSVYREVEHDFVTPE